MMHKKRRWVVQNADGPYKLAYMLTQQTWCCCQGFRWMGYLFLNDATSENGAQEYAVIRESTGLQVESLTASWMTESSMTEFLMHLVPNAGGVHDLWTEPLDTGRLDKQGEHEPCIHCR